MYGRSLNWETSRGLRTRKREGAGLRLDQARNRSTKGFFGACREFFWLFTDSSSIHGLRYLSPTLKIHPLERGVWYVAVLLAIYGTVSLNTSTLRRFFMNPTVISMEHNYKEWNTSFPSVTICPAAKYDEAKIQRLINTEYSHVPDKETLGEFLQSLGNATFGKFADIKGGFFDPKPSKYWEAVHAISFPFFYNLSNSNSELYNQLEMNQVFTEVGICYSYNSITTAYNDPKAWQRNKWKYMANMKHFEGSPLDGDIFAQVMNMNSGYGLYLLDPGEFPDVSIPQIQGGNNTYKTLDLTALSIVSSPQVEGLAVKQRRCRLPWESNLLTSPVYSYNLCRMECRMKACMQRCNCVPFFYRPTEIFPVCGPEGMKCLDKHADQLVKMFDPETAKKIPCDCLQLCNEVNYVIDNDNTMEWTLGTNLKWGLIKYPKFRLRRDILFGQADLLVSFGSTAGLFLGCSLLSFVEIFYFFTLRLVIFIWRRDKERSTGSIHSTSESYCTNSVMLAEKKSSLQSQAQKRMPVKMFDIAMKPVKEIQNVFITFFEFSSLHGFNQLTVKKRHPAEKLLWTITVLLALWGVTSLSRHTWRRFQENPTVVSMERNYQEWNTSFPCITLCPKTKYSEENIRRAVEEFDYVKDKKSLMRFLKELGNATYGSFDALTEGMTQLQKTDYWRGVTRMAYNFDYKVTNSNPDQYPVFKMNSFVSEVGICYSYNSIATYYNDPGYWEQDRWMNLGKFPFFRSSPLDGDGFVQFRYINAGYEMFVLSPAEFPDIALPRLDGPNNTYKTVDLTALSIVSSKATELLSVQQRRCRLQEESNLLTSPVYSYNLCRMECRMKMSYELCGCVPYFYRPTGKFPICDFKGMQCLQNYTDVLKRLLHPETKKKRDCGCLPLCHDVHYFVDSDNTVEWSIGTNLKIGLIKYPKFRLKRDILFGGIDLLVAIGGSAGLFLGCSILSIAEILYFFVMRLFFYFNYKMPLKYS